MNLPKLRDFLVFLNSNNYSKETIYNYQRDLKTFEDFIQLKGFQELNKETFEAFKIYLLSKDRQTAYGSKSTMVISNHSINRLLSALRRYVKYLLSMNYSIHIRSSDISLVKLEKKFPQLAEFEDLKKLVESPTHFEKKLIIAKRNRAMLEVLFSTGMRISELLNIKRNQIDREGKIFIRGKGKKERFVYLTPRATKYLNEYLKARSDTFSPIFIPHEGRGLAAKDRCVSASYLQEKIKQYREMLGINVPTSAHSLRHGFATYMAEQGANPAAIQILLGHESLDTTTRYVHPSQRYAQKTHKQFHPLKE